MKYACIFLLFAGCAWVGQSRVKAIEENPIVNDSTFAVVKPPVRKSPPKPTRRPVFVSAHDTARIVNWPDNRPYKFVLFYERFDTQGNRLEPYVRLQIEQFNADTALGFNDLAERIDRTESDFWVENDTLYLNVPFLRKFNPSASESYVYDWRIRIRLENYFEPERNTGWIYARKVLNLVRADRWVGVPQKPVFIEVH